MLKGVSDAASGANRQEEERGWLEALVHDEPRNEAALVELSRVRAAAHDYDGAVAAASDAARWRPRIPVPSNSLPPCSLT